MPTAYFQCALDVPPFPEWFWPVPLSDGRTILTLLYANPIRSLILELSAKGVAQPWPPGIGYPAPVIFYANPHDELFGLDLIKIGKIYVCLTDGTHRYSLETAIRMDTSIAPTNLFQQENQLFWFTPNNCQMTADLSTGTPINIRKIPPMPSPPHPAHHLLTHLSVDNILFAFNPSPPRISRYKLP